MKPCPCAASASSAGLCLRITGHSVTAASAPSVAIPIPLVSYTVAGGFQRGVIIVDSHRLNHNQLLVPLEKRLLWSRWAERGRLFFWTRKKKGRWCNRKIKMRSRFLVYTKKKKEKENLLIQGGQNIPEQLIPRSVPAANSSQGLLLRGYL